MKFLNLFILLAINTVLYAKVSRVDTWMDTIPISIEVLDIDTVGDHYIIKATLFNSGDTALVAVPISGLNTGLLRNRVYSMKAFDYNGNVYREDGSVLRSYSPRDKCFFLSEATGEFCIDGINVTRAFHAIAESVKAQHD